MELINTKQEVEDFFSKEQFVTDTYSQINKDLNGLTPHVLVEADRVDQRATPMVLMTDQLVDLIEGMSINTRQQFIYRVDIAEAVYLKVLHENDYQLLAYFIIRREAQKVFIRAHYK